MRTVIKLKLNALTTGNWSVILVANVFCQWFMGIRCIMFKVFNEFLYTYNAGMYFVAEQVVNIPSSSREEMFC